MKNQVINFNEKLKRFTDLWSPKIIEEMNDYQFKLVKLKGDFTWHTHDNTDEAFIVLDGEMTIEFRNNKVKISTGEMYVVPRGVEHKPYSINECNVLLIEPRGVINTGNDKNEFTADNKIWI
ncbi:cupin domain-containing protein [candidate division KSB1 bacterium]|nr:cupin domain-containing protein [candidate division KSB1 bacterium]